MKPDQICIIANGEKRVIASPVSVKQFLGASGWKPTQVVVEYNGKVLARSELEQVRLAAGDRLEVIIPVAGG